MCIEIIINILKDLYCDVGNVLSSTVLDFKRTETHKLYQSVHSNSEVSNCEYSGREGALLRFSY